MGGVTPRHAPKKTAVFVEESREYEVQVIVEPQLDARDIAAYADMRQVQLENQVLATRSSGVCC